MNNKVILDLCGGTGAWSKPYKDAGYDVEVITIPKYDVMEVEFDNYGISFVRQDVRWRDTLTFLYEDIYGILAAPPCTMFSIARQRAKTPRDLRGGMEVVQACLDIVHECLYHNHTYKDGGLKFWALENPYTGYLKRFLGRPALIFEPYEYGDPYTKRTAIWGEFNIPKKNEVEPRNFEHPTSRNSKDFVSCVEHFADLKDIPDGYMEKTGYSKRAVMRSMTPAGFAKEFYKANK